MWPLDIRVQIAPGADLDASPATWSWTDITDDALVQPYAITRGRSDEASAVAPSSLRITLDNQEGKYTPGLASSPFYPHVRQGLPLRLAVGHPPQGDGATTEDTEHTAPSVTATEAGLLLCAWAASWAGTYTVPAGMTSLGQTAAGTVSTMAAAWQQVPAGPTGPRTAIFSTGASGEAASVVIHGADGVSPTVVDSAALAVTGAVAELSVEAEPGQWLVAIQWVSDDQLREVPAAPSDGAEWVPLVDHPATVEVDFARMMAWARPVTTTGGQLVAFATTPIRNASISSQSHVLLVAIDAAGLGAIRFEGHVGEITPSWPHGDISAPEAGYVGESEVELVASGITRRLGQGQGRTMPAYWWWARDAYRTQEFGISRGEPAAYWPLDDGPGARHEAAPAYGRHGMKLRSFQGAPTQVETSPRPGEVDLAPWLGTGAVLRRGYMSGQVQMTPVSGQRWTAEMIFRQDQLSEQTAGFINYIVYGTGSGQDGDPLISYSIVIGPGADPENDPATIGMTRTFREGSASSTATLAPPVRIPGLLSGQEPHHVRMRVRNAAGGNSAWAWYLDGVLMQSGTVASAMQPVRSVTVGGTAQAIVVGHVAVWDYEPDIDQASSAAFGWPGETAVARVRRLSREQGVQVQVIGDPEGSAPMGPQPVEPLLDVLQEVADADGGILYETATGQLAYRTRRSMYSQDCHLHLDAHDGIRAPFTPVLDDQGLRNDVTARREGGGDARHVDAEHAAEHGTYSTQVTLPVASDRQLPDQAAWRVHQGTAPGMRYPSLSPDLNTNPALVPGWVGLTLGDLVCVDHLPAQHPAGQVSLLVQGYSETITPDTWEATANTSPGGVWEVGTVGDEAAPAYLPDAPERADTTGSELATEVDADGTLLDVVTTAGPRWITTAEHPDLFPVDLRVGEEIVRATAISDPTPAAVPGAGSASETPATEFVAPSVDADGNSLLICAWCTFEVPGGALTLPDEMVALGGTGGSYSALYAAREPVPAGPTGPRTAVLATADAWSAISMAIAGEASAPVVEETVADDTQGPVTLTTGSSTQAGWWLVAIQALDWDPDGAMVPPTGEGWVAVADSGLTTDTVSRVRAWIRPITAGGPQSATFTRPDGVSDNHGRLVVLSGVAAGPIGQTVTVIRGIGGQPGSHPAGSPVRLAHPAVIAL